MILLQAAIYKGFLSALIAYECLHIPYSSAQAGHRISDCRVREVQKSRHRQSLASYSGGSAIRAGMGDMQQIHGCTWPSAG